MKTKSTLLTMCAVVLIALATTACAEQRAQSQDPNAYAKVTYSYSYPKKDESQSPEESSAVAINGDVMWGIGKNVDEVTEKYGSAAAAGPDYVNNVFRFENGYGTYVFGDGCDTINEISAKDLLVGDLSTVTLDNIAEKCGFNVVPLNNTGDMNTMYEGYRVAYYTHPSYENISFEMLYNESGFDDSALFRVTLDRVTSAITDEFINTINSVIDSAADVEALKSGIKHADADALIFGVRVFEHPAAFEKNTLYTGGELNDGAVILVDFSDGSCYIAVRGERTTDPVPVPDMHMYIVKRADTVEQLKAELAGFARGGQNKAVNSLTLYQDSEAAHAGDDSGEPIIQNGNLVADNDTLKKGGIFRVEYGEQSWVCFASDD